MAASAFLSDQTLATALSSSIHSVRESLISCHTTVVASDALSFLASTKPLLRSFIFKAEALRAAKELNRRIEGEVEEGCRSCLIGWARFGWAGYRREKAVLVERIHLFGKVGVALKKLYGEGIVKHEDLFITFKLWVDSRFYLSIYGSDTLRL